MARAKSSAASSTATIGFEAMLWLAADKLRNNMDAAEYKHVVLGLVFLKYPPDLQQAAVQPVLAQAKPLCADWAA
jgi:type I restriction enzyme M protein